MYWLPKMHKTSIDARFIVASKSCITKPLSEMISKVFKMIFNHVEVFVEKGLFYTCFRKFWVVENSLPIVTKLNKINTKKISQKYFNFRRYHIIHNNSLKFYLKLWILSSNQKLEVALIFQIHQPTGHLTILEEDTSQDMRCHLISHHKMLFYHKKPSFQTRVWHSYENRPSSIWGKSLSIFFEYQYVQQLRSKRSPGA